MADHGRAWVPAHFPVSCRELEKRWGLEWLPGGGVRSFATPLNVQLFFLGAGFMLVETKAVVTMALLFGSTWVVNSVVFLAVLVMILLANLWTLRCKQTRFWPYYFGLLITLGSECCLCLSIFSWE